MINYLLVLVVILSSGDIAVDKLEFKTLKECQTQEHILAVSFENSESVSQYILNCYPFKKLEKS